jgi:hypothetical protein
MRAVLLVASVAACEAQPSPVAPGHPPQHECTAPQDGGPPASDGGSGHGWLEPYAIQRTVRRDFAAYRFCYELALWMTPNLRGMVRVKFVIGLSGEVTSVQDEGSTLPDEAVVQCVLHGIAKLTFPPPECSDHVTVVYPIMFDDHR